MNNKIRNLLIIVDVQNDFCARGGTLVNKQTIDVVPDVCDLVHYDNLFDKVICTMDTHYANYLSTIEGKHLQVMHCQRGDWGWKIEEKLYQALYYHKNIGFVEKSSFAPPFLKLLEEMKLDGNLSACPYDNIFVCGVCTDICVINTALMLKNELDKEIYVIEDCCAGSDPENHYAALRTMKASHINVVTTNDVINKFFKE